MVKRDLIRNIIIAVLAIVVILLLRAFVFSTHRVTEGQANDYIHAGDQELAHMTMENQLARADFGVGTDFKVYDTSPDTATPLTDI